MESGDEYFTWIDSVSESFKSSSNSLLGLLSNTIDSMVSVALSVLVFAVTN